MWTEEYSAAVKSRYVHQNWPINHLGGAAEPSSRTHNWQHVWPPWPVDADDAERWNERPSSQDRLYCTWKHSCRGKKESVWTWELTIYLSASYSRNQGIIPSYISHMFFQRMLGLYRPRMHPPKYSAIHNIIIVCVCLQGKQQENNNDQNYTFLTLFKDLSIMVIDNCNFALLYTRR